MADFDVKALKAGDRVGWSVTSWRSADDGGVDTVKAVTPSGQIVLAGGKRFTPRGGQIGGDAFLCDPERGEKSGDVARLRRALSDLEFKAGQYARQHRAGQPTPLTPAERAELLALIDRCSATT